MTIEIVRLGPADGGRLERVAEAVFDNPVDPVRTREFLADPRHHIVVAIDEGVVVGFASGVHYIHPDKPPELFVNEVAVSPTHQRRGLGAGVLRALIGHAASLGCVSAWVLTDPDNAAARALYATLGGALTLGGGPVPGEVLGYEFTLPGPSGQPPAT